MRSPIGAGEILGVVARTERDASVLLSEDPRWECLRPGLDPGVKMGNRFLAALIGGALIMRDPAVPPA